ncbi:hypothetical protein [Novosphingobium sp. KN65.2]|uniref:hypothetical protein n=1 Tax=Novosphingobium sp. KN65.2 TaxID=1478134 RepID=UPI0005E0FF05|nr:hypothetical protein [Novosphingobium sp. KN65.2]CDO38344.1 exported hypothetical protein [Novosphingobium sp. KN65.2]
MNRYTFTALTAGLVLSLSGCAATQSSDMNTGERISQRGGEITDYGDAWSAGQKDAKLGQRMIDKSAKSSDSARKQLADARADVVKAEARIQAASNAKIEGEQLILDGTMKMQQAEADYARVRAGPSAKIDSPGS